MQACASSSSDHPSAGNEHGVNSAETIQMSRKSTRQSRGPQRLVMDAAWATEPAGMWSSSVAASALIVAQPEEPTVAAACHVLLSLSSEPSLAPAAYDGPPSTTSTAETSTPVTGFKWEPMEVVNESGEVQVFFESAPSGKERPAAMDMFG